MFWARSNRERSFQNRFELPPHVIAFELFWDTPYFYRQLFVMFQVAQNSMSRYNEKRLLAREEDRKMKSFKDETL